MGTLESIQLNGAALVILLVLPAAGCKREAPKMAEAPGSSLIFDNTSPDAREALASPVDFRIDEDNFARWEKAQRNLEALPRSALPTTAQDGRNAVDRAVARLEASPYTRTAIERTGLSVKDFVLETIALAQATEAASTGKSLSRVAIPPGNFQFVQRYVSRALYSRSRVARVSADPYENAPNVDSTSEPADAEPQMQVDEANTTELQRGKGDSPVRDSAVKQPRDTLPIEPR